MRSSYILMFCDEREIRSLCDVVSGRREHTRQTDGNRQIRGGGNHNPQKENEINIFSLVFKFLRMFYVFFG